MSEARSALPGAAYLGTARIEEAGPMGMVTLRGDHAAPALRAAVHDVAGVDVPAQRRIAMDGARGAAWMSPDELLILVPHAQAGATAARLADLLRGSHHLAADVSDARAVFRLSGGNAREVLAKLSPTDMAVFPAGEVRRTRLAQTAAAFWSDGDDPETFTIVCFRSVAQYVFDLLKISAEPGSEIGLWP
jgi:sarcosine oxidase, subunit gamma